MTGTSGEEWHSLRRNRIGASEVAAIIGCNPHASPQDVWADKVLPYKARPDTPATQAGRLLEPGILAIYAARTGRTITPGRFVEGPEPWIGSTPDALDPEPVQSKAVGRFMAQSWGVDGADDGVPIHYGLQLQWEMLCCDAASSHLIAGFDLTDFRVYRVDRDSALLDILVPYVRDWWKQYVVPRDPENWPPGDDAEVIRRAILARYPRNVLSLREASPTDVLAVTAYDVARARLKESEAVKAARANDLCRAIGDADGFTFDGGSRRATWKTNKAGARSLYVSPMREDEE